MRLCRLVVLLFVASQVGCWSKEDAVVPALPMNRVKAESPALPAKSSSAAESLDANHYAFEITDVEALRALESRGYSLQNQLSLGAFRDLWASEIDALTGRIDRDLVRTHHEAKRWTASNVGRRFDTGWLDEDSQGFFQLIGVINRADREMMTGECEVRLIYRLAYRSDKGSSFLPFTVNMVFTDERCLEPWKKPVDVEHLMSSLSFQQVEINVQIVRFPSGVETEFAGQAAYYLAVYDRDGRHLVLENTPAVDDLRANPMKRAALADWINEHTEAIDTGTFQIPKTYLATQAISWSTLGSNRLANKPFDVLFPKGEGLDPVAGSSFQNTAGLVERLNNRTCQGCHQTGSTAGFHFLGEDDTSISGLTNRLQIPFSPHALRDRERRRRHLVTGSVEQPHALRQAIAGRNEECYEGGALLKIPCEPGLHCVTVVENTELSVVFGQCLPTGSPEEAQEALKVGETCRSGDLRNHKLSGTPFGLHGYKDRFSSKQLYDLPENKSFNDHDLNCRPTVIGVPLGRTYRSCTADERALTSVEDEICAVGGGSRFDSCVEEDFHACLSGAMARGMVDSCSVSDPCREDYICQRLPWQHQSMPEKEAKALSEAGIGFCTPTYFLFQLRLDGHPEPMKSVK